MGEYLTYEQVEAIVNDTSYPPEERASYVHGYIQRILPAHFERCPSCAVSSSEEEVMSCLLSEELLAPFVDGVYVTPASLACVVQAFLVGA